MIKHIKHFLLAHEPFRPAHMGNWIREQYFRRYTKKYIPSDHIRDVLDGGCGQGHYARKVANMFPSAKILAVDIGTFPEWEADAPDNVEFRTLDLTQYAEAGARDLIYSVDVLEHIRGNDVVIKNFFHALRPGGYLYLGVPCEDAEQFCLPKKWFARFYQWADDEHVGEMRRLPELKKLLARTGFTVIVSRYTFTRFGHLAWELEFLFNERAWGKKANLILTPLYKLLGWLDILCPIGTGNNLIIAKKP